MNVARPRRDRSTMRAAWSEVAVSVPNTIHTLTLGNASQAWDVLSAQVEALAASWKDAARPPDLASFLPARPPALRRLALVELIKLDLEYRWTRPEWRKLLEAYLDEFPELASGDNVPGDLIYEEYHIRKLAGEEVSANDYFERFPRQAAELGRLLGVEAPHLSTALVSAEKPESFEAGQKIDDFDLLARLGQGAFATVFLARQIQMQRLVALKISADRGTEGQTMAQMDHPNIVRVYDQRLLPARRLRLLHMQYVPGGTLQAIAEQVRRTPPNARNGRLLLDVIDRALDNRGETPPADSSTRQSLARATWWQAVCWMGVKLAGALDYAHHRGVLHRDLKPANVLLAADGSPKLADFNISFCSQVEGATAASYFGGSLAYMSPEQLEAFNPANERTADELGAASDVYSLGIVLWELLTGHRPFRDEEMSGDWSETLDRMVARRRAGIDEATMRMLPADCPAELAKVLLECLEPDLSRRYANAGEAARRLELCLMPATLRLMRPSPRSWNHFCRQAPWTSIIVAGLAPNIFGTALAVPYVQLKLVNNLHSPTATEIFSLQVKAVNPVAYSIGLGVLLTIAAPVLNAVLARNRAGTAGPDAPGAIRDRCLMLGDYVAWVCVGLWGFAGAIFPIWMYLATRALTADKQVRFGYQEHLHWIVSHILLGVLVAMLAFYLVTRLCLRAFYPALVPTSGSDPMAVRGLKSVASRAGSYIFLAFSVMPLSVVAMMFAGSDSRNTFIVLAVVALATSLVETIMSQKIRGDAEALIPAVNPSGDVMAAAVDSVGDSSWSESR